ncbi:HepT-like ribonuclease domain-containing protein [Pseudokineococcus basanitobsidens]|uniref:HepT-like ribonuclease domain-containing protein n=1 Tax=Pseudokineococcus basanitobsidens TaxID=1926649 RepID=A0ABU8RP14_9ACTN
MSPPDLDLGVVHAELDLVDGALTTLASAGRLDAARLRDDALLAAAVERLLSRVVDLAVDVNAHVAVAELGRAPADYRSSFQAAVDAGALPQELGDRLAPSAGLRDVIVHEYAQLDLDRVAAAVPLALDGYRDYVTAVAAFLVRRSS